MPSEPRTEPTLEELSAYVDNELDATTQGRLAQHVAGCQACRQQLEGLRQAASAIRELPMETPPRRFTIPERRRQAWRWAPIGWVASAAVAVLVVGVGVSHLFGGGGASMTAGTASLSRTSNAYAPQAGSGADAAGKLYAQKAAAPFSHGAAVSDPHNSARTLVLGSDSSVYASTGTIRVRIILQGSPASVTSASGQGLSVVLVRSGSGVALGSLTGVSSSDGTPVFGGTYAIAALPLSDPRPGDYTLVASWAIPDGSGRVLQASIPIKITG